MILLTSRQRNFLDRFYIEFLKPEPGYAFDLSRRPVSTMHTSTDSKKHTFAAWVTIGPIEL
jgi:hypothetical protein